MVEDFKYDLIDNPTSFMCSKWLLDRVPHIFNNDLIAFIKWKEELADRLEIDSKSIVITGSASCGFSLNPYKNYKEFDDSSDIDVAIVSEIHFDIAWRTLRNLGTKRYDLNAKQKASLNDHVDRLIYWGTVATDKLLEILPFGKDWSLQLLEMSKLEPVNNKTLNVRLYKDYDALRSYNVANLVNLKNKLFEIPEENGKLS